MGTPIAAGSRTVYEPRYLILALCVFGLLIIHTYNQQWSSDFWEHSAAVRELSRRPLAPRHPILPIDTPHHSFSLYNWTIARAVAWSGASPIDALSWAALINAALILLSFPLAVAALSKRADIAFYSLLFSLLLWGPRPWRYSGFLDLNAFGFVLPYPSMFATGIAFFLIGIMPAFLERAKPWLWTLPIALVIFLATNAHPITGGVLLLACLALTVSRRPALITWVSLGLAVAIGIVLAVVWPLFPLLNLAAGGPSDFVAENWSMYVSVFSRTAPALLGLPLLLRRVKRNPLDPLVILFGGLLATYAAGYVTSNWALGRVMPFLVLLLFMCLAEWVVDVEKAMGSRSPAKFSKKAVFRFVLAGVLLVTSINVLPGLVRAVPIALLPHSLQADARLDRGADTFSFLTQLLADEDIVIAQPKISFIIPTFGGKTVSSRPHPLVFDGVERRADAERFFRASTPSEAIAILRKYHVTKIVVDKETVPDPWSFRRYGAVIFSNARFEVIAIRQQ